MEKNKRVRKAVIPAAGFGTRFLPQTKAMPKEMLPIVDKPVIQYVVEELVASGITDIVIVTGWHKRAIEDHFDYSFELEHNLQKNGKLDKLELLNGIQEISNLASFIYIRQKEALGLGHAIYCAKDLIDNDEMFAVILPDNITDNKTPWLVQMMSAYKKHQKPILGLKEVPENHLSRYGIIKPRIINKNTCQVLDIIQKPKTKPPSRLADAGRYILPYRIFDILEKQKPGQGDEIQLTDAICRLASLQEVYGYNLEGTWYDAGDKIGFIQATLNFALKRPDLKEDLKEYLRNLKLN